MNRRMPLALGLIPACLSGLMLSFPAAADTDVNGKGWYAGAEVGVNLGTNLGLNSGSASFVNDYNSGLIGGFNGGYAFSNGLRPELAFDYRHAGISSLTVSNSNGNTAPTTNVGGSLSVLTLMGNLWYDFRQADGFLSVVYPYVGAGVGIARVDLSNENFNEYSNIGVFTSTIANGSATAFAYQFGLGVDYDIIPELTASFDIRYLLTTNYSISTQGSGGGSLSGEYRAPSITLGLRYKFGGDQS